MYFPLFASLIIFTVWLYFQIHHTNKKSATHVESFWERERRANSVRAKSLADLDYVTIPLSQFPMDILTQNDTILACHETLRILSEEKIVNFTGISNTDLKLSYGAANLTKLSTYDQNYTVLVRTLQTFGKTLYENGYPNEALVVLEFALSTNTDIVATYQLLNTIYTETGQPEKIEALKEKAKSLPEQTCNRILNSIDH